MNENKLQQAQQKQVQQSESQTLKGLVNQMMPAIKSALPSVITPERFARIVTTALSSNPKLQDCTHGSFLGAMMTAAQLGVEPNTPLGQAYLIPYKNHGTLECQFQLGYKGMIDLAYRSGQVVNISATTVYENDEFSYSLGLDPVLDHKPCMSGERGNPIAFYAVWKSKDGGYGFEVMSIEDVRKHGQRYSKSFGNGPWKTNFEEMAKKTVLKKALKYAPISSDFVRQVNRDETVTSIEDAEVDVLDLPVDFIVDDNGEVIEDAE